MVVDSNDFRDNFGLVEEWSFPMKIDTIVRCELKAVACQCSVVCFLHVDSIH